MLLVTHRLPNPGTHKVTLMVSPLRNLHKVAQLSLKISPGHFYMLYLLSFIYRYSLLRRKVRDLLQ